MCLLGIVFFWRPIFNVLEVPSTIASCLWFFLSNGCSWINIINEIEHWILINIRYLLKKCRSIKDAEFKAFWLFLIRCHSIYPFSDWYHWMCWMYSVYSVCQCLSATATAFHLQHYSIHQSQTIIKVHKVTKRLIYDR